MALVTITKDYEGQSISMSQEAATLSQAIQLGTELSETVDAIVDRMREAEAKKIEEAKPNLRAFLMQNAKGYPAPAVRFDGGGHA